MLSPDRKWIGEKRRRRREEGRFGVETVIKQVISERGVAQTLEDRTNAVDERKILKMEIALCREMVFLPD